MHLHAPWIVLGLLVATRALADKPATDHGHQPTAGQRTGGRSGAARRTPVRAALKAFTSVEMSAAERQVHLREALGPSATESAHQLVKDVARALPSGGFEALGTKGQKLLRPNGELRGSVQRSAWSVYVPEDLARAGRKADSFLANSHTPEARGQIDRGLNVVRVAARIEEATLSRIAFRLPSTKQVAKQQLARYIGRLARALIDEARQMEPGFKRRFRQRIADLNQRLLRDLAETVESTPDQRAALKALGNDLRVTGKMITGALRMAGAMQNERMPPENRAAVIKGAVEEMGPIFIKLFQTAINQPDLRRALVGPSNDPSHPVLLALRSLQDHVTPMPFHQVRKHVERELGKSLEQAYTWFSPEPLASGSIGQIHPAKIRLQGKEVDVVVKVQRGNLEKEFDDTVRLSQLAIEITKEMLKLSDDVPPKLRRQVEQVTSSVESTLPDLIRSFRVETDFDQEARATTAFARALRHNPRVKVPSVFADLSSRRVMTMERVRGESLSRYFQRYLLANQTRATPIQRTPLPRGREQAVAEERVRSLAAQTFGLSPREMTTVARPNGFLIKLTFDHPLQKEANAVVHHDGRMLFEERGPDFSPRAMANLRTNLVENFAAQNVVHRKIHGDLHEGNFLVLPDGQSVALLDFGNVVEPKRRDYGALSRMLTGFLLGRPRMMAEGVVGMSDRSAALSRAERESARLQVEQELTKTLGPRLEQASPKDMLQSLMRCSSMSGVPLSSTHLQWIKTSISMSGNIDQFQSVGVRGVSKADLIRSGLRMVKEALRR